MAAILLPVSVVNNAASGLVMIATTTLVQHIYTSRTAKGRAQALEELYRKLQDRHQHFVNTILPQLPKTKRQQEPCFKNAQAATTMLNIYGSKKDQIMGQLAEATFVQRLSGTFIAKDIDELLDKLMEFEKNTTERSTRANMILEELGEAVYSQAGVTIEDETGNKVNYRAEPYRPSDVDNNTVPKEQDQDDSLSDDISASTSSVVTVR